MILKEEYNKLVTREKKAEKYLDDPMVSSEQRDKWLPAFIKIINQLGQLIIQIEEESGTKMTRDEILNGFNEIVR